MVSETHEHRIKRMKMRSMRRGIKEMDIVLSAYAEDRLAGMSEAQLDLYDVLLEENDQDLLSWVTGQVAAPESLSALIAAISAHAMRV
ncbi:MAG: antitoxin CptB, partial [Halocynthiibacter sp.]